MEEDSFAFTENELRELLGNTIEEYESLENATLNVINVSANRRCKESAIDNIVLKLIIRRDIGYFQKPRKG